MASDIETGGRTRKSRSGKQAHGSREMLLDAASSLMIRTQSVDISLSELASHSGLNSALVKYYFGSKNGMLVALMKRAASTALAQLDYLKSMPISPTAKMKLHIAGIINTYHRFPYWNRLVHYLLQDPTSAQSAEIVEFFVKPLIEFQRDILAEGVRAGEFRQIDPMNFYFSVVGACDAPFFARFVFDLMGVEDFDDQRRRSYIAHVTELVLSQLLVEPERARGADGGSES